MIRLCLKLVADPRLHSKQPKLPRKAGSEKSWYGTRDIELYIHQADIDGVTHASYRRIAELTGVNDTALVRDHLLTLWPNSEDCCVWRVPSTLQALRFAAKGRSFDMAPTLSRPLFGRR